MLFMPGDLVRYIGSKYKDISNKIGEVVAKVKGTTSSTYVVDFASASYIMGDEVIVKHKSSNDSDLKETEVQVHRKKHDEED